MKTIWKFALNPGRTVLDLPSDAAVLSVQAQRDEPMLWVLLDTGAPRVRRFFDTYGTGHRLPADPGNHVGTLMFEDGASVWHVFESYA